MNDREMLELAAKAAALEYIKQTEAQRLADGLLAETSKFGTPSIQRGLVNGAIQELRRLDSENQRQRADLERKSEAIQRLWAERDQLRAQLEQAVQQYKEDAERYRWLADSNNYYEAINLISDGALTEDALGKAIDAAMAQGVK